MIDFWAALGSLAGWLAVIVLTVGLCALLVSWAVIKLVERETRRMR